MIKNSIWVVSALALVSGSALAGGSISVRRDTVIPVVFDDSLTIQGNQPGDHFRAHVDDDHDLPFDTKLEGRITGIKDKRGNDPAMMELQFTDVILPDGTDVKVDAVPISLSDKSVHRDRDGRFAVQRDDRKTGNTVLGGAIGGFIIGSILHKQFEGVVLGALAGVIAASADKGNDGNTVIKNGDRMGMLLNRDLVIQFRGDRPNPVRNDDGWRRPNDNSNSHDTTPAAPASGGFDVRYHDQSVNWGQNKPYWEKFTLMVPVTCLSSLDLHSSDDLTSESTRDVYIDGPNGSLQLQIGSTEAHVGGKPLELDVAPVRKNGVVYVPLKALIEVTKDPVLVNGNQVARSSDGG